MIKVTAIVPVHNTAKYLKRCIESLLLNETSVEILLIDDFSSDNSLEIANNYSKKCDKVKVISLDKNMGVSYARNLGIKNATGDYVMFCDSDDWYEPNSVDILLSYALKCNADFVMANYFLSYNNKKLKVDTSSYFLNSKITKKEAISYMTLTSCSKLIKKELFFEHNIFYPTDVKRCEELTVIPVLAFYAKKAIVIKEYLYNYFQREGSASNSYNVDVSYFDKTFDIFCNMINGSKYKIEVEFRAIEHLLYGKTLVMLKNNIQTKEIKKHIQKFNNEYKNYRKNKYLKKFNIIKRMFILTLNSRCLLFHKAFAYFHGKITR